MSQLPDDRHSWLTVRLQWYRVHCDISTPRLQDEIKLELCWHRCDIHGCIPSYVANYHLPPELDPKSRACAISNVACNSMEDRIEIFEASAGGPLLGPLSSSEGPRCVLLSLCIAARRLSHHARRYEFTMCNPPFYTSAQDVLRSAEGKELGPNGVSQPLPKNTLTSNQTNMPGLHRRRSRDDHRRRRSSLRLSHDLRVSLTSFSMQVRSFAGRIQVACRSLKPRWYTSMVGKMSSLSTIVALLREHKINNYGLTELVQGQTKRWAVAWSFFDKRLPDASAP